MPYSMHAVACPSTSTVAQLSLSRASVLTAVAALQLGNINKPTGYNATSSGLQTVNKWLKFSGQVTVRKTGIRSVAGSWGQVAVSWVTRICITWDQACARCPGQTAHEFYNHGKRSPLAERRIPRHPTFQSAVS